MKEQIFFYLYILQTCTSATIVINEINADQPGTDSLEYIELYNTSPSDVVMDGYTLVLFNGAVNPGAAYTTIPLDGHCISGLGYFIIGSPTMVNPVANLQFSTESNSIQNGGTSSTDGTGLYFGDTSNTANLVDMVVYSTYVEQTSAVPFYPDYLPQDVIAIEDGSYDSVNDESLSRCSGNAVKDMTQFETRSISPGTPNLCDGSVAPLSVPAMASENCGSGPIPTTVSDVTTDEVTTPYYASLNLLNVFKKTKNTKMADGSLLGLHERSLMSCAALCLRQAACVSLSYQRNEGKCVMHSENIASEPGLVQPQEGWTYAERIVA